MLRVWESTYRDFLKGNHVGWMVFLGVRLHFSFDQTDRSRFRDLNLGISLKEGPARDLFFPGARLQFSFPASLEPMDQGFRSDLVTSCCPVGQVAGQNQGYHFGVDEFTTHFRTYLSGWIESDVHWGLTDLDFDPWALRQVLPGWKLITLSGRRLKARCFEPMR